MFISPKNILYPNVFLLFISIIDSVSCQENIIQFDKDHLSAKVLYSDNEGVKKINDATAYPVIGSYSPTSYANPQYDVEENRGFCDYIYLPTEGKLKPGIQYTLSMTLKLDEAYSQLSFYQDHFGIALTDYLYENSFPSHWGLWHHSSDRLHNLHGGELINLELEFRPMCTSEYFVLGVFQGLEKDPLSCFHCIYPFELYDLSISESNNPNKDCVYFGDAFKQPEPKPGQNETTIYFESGSAKISDKYNEILDSISSRVKFTEDILLLSAFTDKSGTDNESLGAARNESVRQAFIKRGINNASISKLNHSDTKAAQMILSTDRKVVIDIGGGMVYKKLYTSALEAAEKEDYPTAHKIMNNEWIKNIPTKKAIYALFDCWGESDKAKAFKKHLHKTIKSKLYKKQHLRFELDSLNAEYLKGRSLSGHLTLNRIPGESHDCLFNTSNKRDSLLRLAVDQLIKKNGIPDKAVVGREANQVLSRIILTSNELQYLEAYLPLIKTACEKRQLSWDHYAKFYDYINVLKNGFQRYGTKMMRGPKGTLIPEFPFEDETMVDEYRRQVKLAPYTKSIKSDINTNQRKIEPKLVTLLNEVYLADQHHRNRINERYRNFEKWKETDSLNQIQVRKILDERGWLGPDVVGQRGNTTLFLVIQHSDLKTQLKYLPMMREAVKKGNAKGKDLALLEDRVALGQGKKQLYGSQIYEDPETGEHYVAPLENPETVNERRAAIGLGSIENYVRRWNIVWKVDE